MARSVARVAMRAIERVGVAAGQTERRVVAPGPHGHEEVIHGHEAIGAPALPRVVAVVPVDHLFMTVRAWCDDPPCGLAGGDADPLYRTHGDPRD